MKYSNIKWHKAGFDKNQESQKILQINIERVTMQSKQI